MEGLAYTLSLGPPQVVVPGTPERPKSPTEPVNTSHTNQDKGFIAAQPGETEEEKENRTMHNRATIMGRAFSIPLQSTLRSLSSLPGPAQPKSKIPATEKYDGKRAQQQNHSSWIVKHTSSAIPLHSPQITAAFPLFL
jgi:hypothetical protein